LRVHSWMGLALIGWALLAHVRERVTSAGHVLLTKKPTPLEPPPVESPLRGPRIWN